MFSTFPPTTADRSISDVASINVITTAETEMTHLIRCLPATERFFFFCAVMGYLITAYNFHHRELNSAGFAPSPRGRGLVGGSRTIRDKLKRECCPPGILSQHQGASARLSFLSVFYFTNFHCKRRQDPALGLQLLRQTLSFHSSTVWL